MKSIRTSSSLFSKLLSKSPLPQGPSLTRARTPERSRLLWKLMPGVLLLGMTPQSTRAGMGVEDGEPAAQVASLSTRASQLPAERAPGDTDGWMMETERLPIPFEPNRGQTAQEVRFLARGASYGVFLTEQELVLGMAQKVEGEDGADVLLPAWLRMAVEHSTPVEPVAESALASVSHYLIGSTPAGWLTGVPQSQAVRYRGLRPGVDLVVSVEPGQLRLRFELQPGVDPAELSLLFSGLERPIPGARQAAGRVGLTRLRTDHLGGLELAGPGGLIKLSPPELTQQVEGQRSQVLGAFIAGADGKVRLSTASFNAQLPTRAESTLSFSATLGGTADDAATAVGVDAAGNLYVAGQSWSANYPTTTGAYDTSFNGSTVDAFVTKLDPTGSRRIYSTYLGGSTGGSSGYVGWDTVTGLMVDTSGGVVLSGYTYASNFPVTSGAFQSKRGGGNTDGFVTRLDATGAKLSFSTYLGGSDSDAAEGVALAADGSVVVTGYTYSTNYPVSSTAYQKTNRGWADAVVTRLASTGASAIFSTYLGGSAGSGGSYGDFGKAVAVGADGSIYVAGHTLSTDFPVSSGAYQLTRRGSYDGFLAKLSGGGDTLLYSTYLGGTGMEVISGLAVDKGAGAWVVGSTTSTDAPVSSTAFQKAHAGGTYDVLLSRLDTSKNGSAGLVFSTYLGGSGQDMSRQVRVDRYNTAFLTGGTQSKNFPTSSDGAVKSYQGGEFDGFLSRVSATGGSVLYGGYVGGSAYDYGIGLGLDKEGQPVVVGSTSSMSLSGGDTAGSSASREAFVARYTLPVPVSQREETP